ncbi:hypothetical protein, partial [Escherichia coli]|uniref:hypothetical protein n=1 Tax=Escherichia coli TaxID=562 RepID=UPI001BC8B5A5
KEEIFDAVIFATSAEVTLSLLTEATAQQREILSYFVYHDIKSVAHHDTRYLGGKSEPHYLNYCQFIDFPAETLGGSVTRAINALSPYRHLTTPLLVTLDPKMPIDPQKQIKTCRWRVARQLPGDFAHKMRLKEIQGKANMWFCGVDT